MGLTFGAAAVASVYGGIVVLRLGAARTTQASMVSAVAGLALLAIICAIMIVASAALLGLDASWPKPAVYCLFFALGASGVGWNGIVHAECARLSPSRTISLTAGATSFSCSAG